MEKINFEDGQLVSAGYVEIDGVQHEIHEAEYEGDTPLSAHTLNLMQTNIEEEINNSSIVVSPTEPQTNRKKVWMQKGKNLFDKNNVIRKDNYILNDSGIETADSTGGYTRMYIPVKPNTIHTISGLEAGGTKRIYFFDKNKNFVSRTAGLGSPEVITTPNNCYYIDFQYYINNVNFDTYQLEQGSTATSYETYIEPKIYVLNDNNVYEEFMKKEKVEKKEEYTETELVIGKWFGRTLYRKVVSFGALPSSGIKSIEHNISNLDKIVNLHGKADNNTTFLPLPYAHTDNTLNISLYANKTKVFVEVGSNRASFTTCAIILEYVKTTD